MILYDEVLLSLLMTPSKAVPEGIDWDQFWRVARKNVVAVRAAIVLKNEVAAEDEIRRIRETLPLIGKLGELCRRASIDFVMPKAFLHYPDMGHDVDLFVMDRGARIDSIIVTDLGGKPLPDSLVNRISRKTGYEIPGFSTPVEVHHGRMGHLREYAAYPRRVIERRVEISVGGVTTWIPALYEHPSTSNNFNFVHGIITLMAIVMMKWVLGLR